MSERLVHKLADGQNPGSGSAAVPRDKALCLVVDERSGFSCEFQTAAGWTWLLPYQRLISVELGDKGDALIAVFLSHQVLVQGANLSRIKEAMARGRNILVRAVPVGRKAEYQGEDVFVSEVQVVEKPTPEAKTLDEGPPGSARPRR
ncbi:MAG TPA: hypothetical protein VG838_08420 [Opitutaceae bacterium]|nr:hypothetical protein [Opitutaceae bacterium]